MKHQKHSYLLDFTDKLMSKGRYSFSLGEIRSLFKNGKGAIQQALRRLVLKNKIVSIRRNFYVIISPEYSAQRIPPPSLFIDDLMRYSKKPYYVSLLSAAVLHGSAHQQPQEFFVTTIKPPIRKISVRSIIINFITSGAISDTLIERIQTQSGYMTVSCPELTAVDCIRFASRIGGMGRAAAVIHDLIPRFTVSGTKKTVGADVPVMALQRLGFLLERYKAKEKITDILYHAIHKHRVTATMLSPSHKPVASPARNRWSVDENIDIAVEE
jgi:predicted transcriptional regulator of viral defense system